MEWNGLDMDLEGRTGWNNGTGMASNGSEATWSQVGCGRGAALAASPRRARARRLRMSRVDVPVVEVSRRTRRV